MGVVLGLSLTSDEVVWALIDECADECERALLDHDALTVPHAVAGAVTAARSAQSIATAAGLDIDRVRVTGADAGDVVARLQSAGFRSVEVVGHADVLGAAPQFAPRLQAAAGAALCRPARDCAPAPTRRRRSVLATLVGTAAAAVLSVLFLAAGSVPQDAHAVAAAPAAVADSGWVSVPVPSSQPATATRKVVTSAPRKVTSAAPVYVAARPAPAPAPVAAPMEQPPTAVTDQHLTGSAPLAGPLPATSTDELPWMSDPAMTDLSNMFTALP